MEEKEIPGADSNFNEAYQKIKNQFQEGNKNQKALEVIIRLMEASKGTEQKKFRVMEGDAQIIERAKQILDLKGRYAGRICRKGDEWYYDPRPSEKKSPFEV